ncbi:AI-2E family transporter [Sphingomonas sp. CJ99]
MSKMEELVDQGPGPNELRDPFIRREVRRASVWAGVGIAIALVVLLIQPLLIIFAALVFASMLDGGVRLLGRVLPIWRGVRLLIVLAAGIGFLAWVFYTAGVQITAQAEQLRVVLEIQGNRLIAWANATGILPDRPDLSSLAQQAAGSIGRLTSAVGSLVGAVTTMLLIFIIGLFVAMDPRIYERGLAWVVPSRGRRDFAITLDRMAWTMRRLLAGRLIGMAFEGVVTWIALSLTGVPMALVLGILTGLLAFIPNIGALISGILMVAVGFSAGQEQGVAAIIIYFAVQNFDGYVVIPMIAKHTVDMPPALTVSSQVLASTLFGVLGLALADPLVAMLKVALERESEREAESASLEAALVGAQAEAG